MDKNTKFDPENISTKMVITIVFVAGIVILSVCAGYLLVVAWLLTLFASLTYAQAAAIALLIVAGGFVVLARLPKFDIIAVLLSALAFAILALVEVLLARLIVLITPLSIWEASLLMACTATLLMFIVVQMILDSAADEGEDDDDDWNASTVARRLSPDMYVLKPRVTETPTPRPPRPPRKRKKKADESNTD